MNFTIGDFQRSYQEVLNVVNEVEKALEQQVISKNIPNEEQLQHQESLTTDQLIAFKNVFDTQIQQLNEYNMATTIEMKRMQRMQCCDPIPRTLWLSGGCNGLAMLMRIGAVAAQTFYFAAYNCESLIIPFIAFGLYLGGEAWAFVGGRYQDYKALGIDNLRTIYDVHQIKTSQFERYGDYLNQLIGLTQLLENQKKPNIPNILDISSQELELSEETLKTEKSTSSDQLSDKESKEKTLSTISEDFLNEEDELIEDKTPTNNQNNSTVIFINKQEAKENKKEPLISDNKQFKNNRKPTLTKEQLKEYAMTISKNKQIDAQIRNCAQVFLDLPEDLRSNQAYETLISFIISKLPADHKLRTLFDEMVTENASEMSQPSPNQAYYKHSPIQQPSNEKFSLNAEESSYQTSSLNSSSNSHSTSAHPTIYLGKDKAKKIKKLAAKRGFNYPIHRIRYKGVSFEKSKHHFGFTENP